MTAAGTTMRLIAVVALGCGEVTTAMMDMGDGGGVAIGGATGGGPSGGAGGDDSTGAAGSGGTTGQAGAIGAGGNATGQAGTGSGNTTGTAGRGGTTGTGNTTGTAGAGGSCPGSVLVLCGTSCVDTGYNKSHCGGCNRPCTTGSCQQGECRQATGAPLCADIWPGYKETSGPPDYTPTYNPCGGIDSDGWHYKHKGKNICMQCFGAGTTTQPADCLINAGLYVCEDAGRTTSTPTDCGSLCVTSCGDCS